MNVLLDRKNMKKRYIPLMLLSSVMLQLSCDDNAIFEEELYKKTFALVSDGEYNIFEETFQLNGGESIGYIAAVTGGTGTINEDIDITLKESRTHFDIYNRSIYDADEERYARLLSQDHYDIDDYQIRILAGERQGRMMLRVRPEGLSPDSTYFIPLIVSDYSNSEINESKRNILYRVLIENEYASQARESLYRMNGVYDGVVTAGNKLLQPLAWNKVRMMAGTEPFQSDLTLIERSAIVLEVAADNRVRVHPYGNITVRQINSDPDFPNVFIREMVDGRTYNVFLVHYEYVLAGTTHTMKEELRMEVQK